MTPFPLPAISLEDLGNYREDNDARVRFERRFSTPCQIGFFAAFVGIICAVFIAQGAVWPLIIVALGMTLLVGGLSAMFLSTPLSTNGEPMKKYWTKDSASDGDEVIYVCDETKTYFRRTWAKKTRSRA